MRSFPVGARIARASCADAPNAEAASATAAVTRTIQGFMGYSAVSERDDNLAEMLVGFHVLEGFADVVEGKDLVDRQLQFARFHRRPDVLADLVENLADFLDRSGAEGDADITDPSRGMQIEVEIGMGATEPADIDDAALDLGGLEILSGDVPGYLIDDQIDAVARGRLQDLIDPAGIAGIDREVRAELLQPAAPR